MTPYQFAEKRTADMDPVKQGVFLAWFEQGRVDERSDVDRGWRILLATHGAAAAAGYLEGIASARPLVPLPQPDRRDSLGRYTEVPR